MPCNDYPSDCDSCSDCESNDKRIRQLESRNDGTQYTPYWCDGEPCEFSVNKHDISFNEKRAEDLYMKEVLKKEGNHDFPEDVLYHPKTGKPLWKKTRVAEADKKREILSKQKTVIDILGIIGEETLEQLFGEGLVTVYRDKVVVKDYEHD